MKKQTSIAIDEENLERLDSDKLATQLGRSGIVRVALSEYFERKEMSEKENKNKKGEK